MARHNQLGEAGEKTAAHYLQENGYEILDNNWRYQKAEVDIIARNDAFIVFVEVKTRTSNAFGEPQTFVSNRKQDLLQQAAEAYMEQNGLENEIRFDIIAIIQFNNHVQIEHFVDAF